MSRHDDKCRWISSLSMSQLDNLRSLFPRPSSKEHETTTQVIIGVFVMYASWNQPFDDDTTTNTMLEFKLVSMAQQLTYGLRDCRTLAGLLQVDVNDESLALYIGDDHKNLSSLHKRPIPPQDLPCLAIALQQGNMPHSTLHYVRGIRSITLVRHFSARPLPLNNNNDMDIETDTTTRHDSTSSVYQQAQWIMEQLEEEYDLPVTPEACGEALRIFVAGDKSSVGKSSVCLGILGNLVSLTRDNPPKTTAASTKSRNNNNNNNNKGGTLPTLRGVKASELAYIKPATQSESTQLIQLFCEKHKIACRPIGPLVYYRGFTRAFLAGLTGETTSQLLQKCGNAVDRLARGKRVILIDGVGFPAVGSICGTDNAQVARACAYPMDHNGSNNDRQPMGVLLVGGSGVGAAVDAFNLNATYFESAGVPVMGAIFNKLSNNPDDFYSLANCRSEVTKYFDQNPNKILRNQRPFGFVPLYPGIAGEKGMEVVDDFLDTFREYSDIDGLLAAAMRIKQGKGHVPSVSLQPVEDPPKAKRQKLNGDKSIPRRNRQEIEQAAIQAGAAPSA